MASRRTILRSLAPLGDLRAEFAALLREAEARPAPKDKPADHRSALAIVLAKAKAKP